MTGLELQNETGSKCNLFGVPKSFVNQVPLNGFPFYNHDWGYVSMPT